MQRGVKITQQDPETTRGGSVDSLYLFSGALVRWMHRGQLKSGRDVENAESDRSAAEARIKLGSNRRTSQEGKLTKTVDEQNRATERQCAETKNGGKSLVTRYCYCP